MLNNNEKAEFYPDKRSDTRDKTVISPENYSNISLYKKSRLKTCFSTSLKF